MKETVRIIRFIIVGTLNAVIAALVVWVLMHICRLDYMIANISAYTAAQINNFLWCKETKKNSIQRQILFFLIAFAMAYSAQFVFLLVLVELLHLNEYLAQFLGLFVYGAVNFISNKMITFK